MTCPTDAHPYERGQADMRERAVAACESIADELQHGHAAIAAQLHVKALPILPDPSAPAQPGYQARVDAWIQHCFGPVIAADRTERNQRFLEEALELVQSGGCTEHEAVQLVRYVYARPVGDLAQEVGGVMNTLAALCTAHGVDMMDAAEAEMVRVWGMSDRIRAKQVAKPKHSPLPEAPAQPQPGGEDALVERHRAEALCTAWQSVFEGIEAHLLDRIAMGDQGDPRSYLAIIRASVARVLPDSKQIVASRWADAAEFRAAIAALRASEPDVRAQALEEAAQVCERARTRWAELAEAKPAEAAGYPYWGARALAADTIHDHIRALIVAPPPVPSHDPHLSTWREGVEAAAVVLDALGDHSHDKGTLPGALAALCASQCARHVRNFGAQGRPDLARPVPPAGSAP